MGRKLRIEEDKLVLELTGVDEIFSLKRTIEIPLKHILDVSTEKVSWDFSKQVKVAGAHIPYLIKEGLFLSDEGLIFFDMHNPEKCITIVLDNEKYKKIVFEVDDKENTADEIKKAIEKFRQK